MFNIFVFEGPSDYTEAICRNSLSDCMSNHSYGDDNEYDEWGGTKAEGNCNTEFLEILPGAVNV